MQRLDGAEAPSLCAGNSGKALEFVFGALAIPVKPCKQRSRNLSGRTPEQVSPVYANRDGMCRNIVHAGKPHFAAPAPENRTGAAKGTENYSSMSFRMPRMGIEAQSGLLFSS